MNRDQIKNESFWKYKKMVITGGTAGLGLELARQALTLGAQVVVVGRDSRRFHSLPDSDRKALHFIEADVASKESIYKIAGEALGILGGIDILINNASYLGVTPLRSLVDSDCEDLELAIQTNVLAPFRLTKAFVGGMILQRSGLVVNISSDAAVSAYPGWGGYGASKAATDQLTKIFSEELRAQGVQFLAIDPGDMDTAMHRAAIPEANPADLHRPELVASQLLSFLPLSIDLETVRYAADQWRVSLKGAGHAEL